MYEIGILVSVLPIARTTSVGHLPERESGRQRPASLARTPPRGIDGSDGFPWHLFAAPAAVLVALFLGLGAMSRWGPLP